MKWSDKLLVLYLTSLSIFRIDFFLQKGGFYFTPYLLLSLLLILIAPFYLISNIKINKNILYLFFMLLAFLGWSVISVIPYWDFLQLKRLALFAVIILSTISFFIILSQSQNVIKIFDKFSKLFVITYITFCAIDVFLYIKPEYQTNVKDIFPAFVIHFSHISYYLIRLKGAFFDSNVGGYFLIFLYLILSYLNIKSKAKTLIPVLIFCSFSRSTIGTFIIIWLLLYLYKKASSRGWFRVPIKVSYSRLKKILLSTILIIVSGYAIMMYTDIGARVQNAVVVRLSTEDESTSIHVDLLEHGANFIYNNPKYLVKGYGFSSSFLLTQKFFPGNKYANFHSEYITILIETGIIGALIYLSLFVLPGIVLLFSKNINRNIYLLMAIVAVIMENVFYQQYLFHYYWIFLGLIWVLPYLKLEDETPIKRVS